ncbi:MAG TPA: tetratricopeptide repeat protein, partial [Vicinamibacterales bacterium]|nr:tetratricopeptide repeat protein [Vicinamibacterales bacterium]
MWFILALSVASIPEASSPARPLAGERVAIAGKLALLSRRDARALVERLGGRVLDTTGDGATLVVGDFPPELASNGEGIRCMSEGELCEAAGLPATDALRAQFKTSRDIRAMYPGIRDEHLRFFEKWGLVRPVAGRFYGFSDLHLIRQAAAELDAGTPLQTVVRSLTSRREGQLQLDFQTPRGRDGATHQARVVTLARKAEPPPALFPVPPAPQASDEALAGRYFMEGARLDDGTDENQDAAIAAYRRALIVDPELVPALVNLANIHYARDLHIEAMALYERALALEPDCFEAHFNLGNVHHDLSRFDDALAAYREAVSLNPGYPEAHFYLAVTLEKMGRSPEARPHWRLYRELAPEGEWAELAKEFE